MSDVLSFVVSHAEEILVVVSLLLAAAGVVAKLTPSDTDNRVLSAIKGVVDAVAGFVKRKPAPAAPPQEVVYAEEPAEAPKSGIRSRLDRK